MILFLPALKALNTAKVRYVVVGGLAVILHGHNRLTGDIDIVLELTSNNICNALKIFSELGFVPRAPVKAADFADETIRKSWIEEKGMVVFAMYQNANPLFGLDLFVQYPLPFERLYENKVLIHLAGEDIPTASIDDIIEMKQVVNRPKDNEDIASLKIIKYGRKE